MTDWHVHTGKYHEVYYYADRVFSALRAAGVDEANPLRLGLSRNALRAV